jgi:clan AA aspartic protease
VPAKTVSLNNAGHPFIKVKVFGIAEQLAQEFDALIDTGFTGFLMLPLTAALPLGLTLISTTAYTLADGSSSLTLVALGTVELEGQKVFGPISLESNVNCKDVLLGMEFIRQANQLLILSSQGAVLVDMSDFPKPTAPVIPTEPAPAIPATPPADAATPETPPSPSKPN